MKRDVRALADNGYDLLIVGGGIYGACVAWDATLRGLSVALVEKADFGSATSANSLKIIHGGFRYLQHADLKRMRASNRERRALMRMAPHLVHPLPVLVPTYGHGIRGKEAFSLALMVNDLISFDRNQLQDPQKHIPRGRVISKQECLRLLPGIPPRGLTGGAIFHDAQVYNSERLLLAFLRSAAEAGAVLANYVEVTGFLNKGDCVTGVAAQDRLTENRFDIRARMVVNTCGPWVDQVLGFLDESRRHRGGPLAKAINLVTRPLFHTYAVGIPGRNGYQDIDAVFDRGRSFLFITPWRGQSLIGTAYAMYDGDPDDCRATEQEVQHFLGAINQAYPAANLKRDDLSFVHSGLLPSAGVCGKSGSVQLRQHSRISDHRHAGVQGLMSVTGVKYTTARSVAAQVVDRIFETWGHQPPRSTTDVVPLYGGQIERFDDFVRTESTKCPCGLAEEGVRRLVSNYGAAYPHVLRYVDTPADHLAVLRAEVLHGVREEMAQTLSDVVLRRTELGTAGHPGDECLRACANIMGAELAWSPARIQQEVQEVHATFAGVKTP